MVFSPIIIATIIAVVLGIALSIRPCGPDKALTRLMVWTAISCMWLMWLCTFLSQMNPLVQPQLDFATAT